MCETKGPTKFVNNDFSEEFHANFVQNIARKCQSDIPRVLRPFVLFFFLCRPSNRLLIDFRRIHTHALTWMTVPARRRGRWHHRGGPLWIMLIYWFFVEFLRRREGGRMMVDDHRDRFLFLDTHLAGTVGRWQFDSKEAVKSKQKQTIMILARNVVYKQSVWHLTNQSCQTNQGLLYLKRNKERGFAGDKFGEGHC